MSAIIKENLNLMGLVKYLNEKFEGKANGKPFNAQDVQQYIRIGYIPAYFGSYRIERVKEIHSVKLYNLIKE